MKVDRNRKSGPWDPELPETGWTAGSLAAASRAWTGIKPTMNRAAVTDQTRDFLGTDLVGERQVSYPSRPSTANAPRDAESALATRLQRSARIGQTKSEMVIQMDPLAIVTLESGLDVVRTLPPTADLVKWTNVSAEWLRRAAPQQTRIEDNISGPGRSER